MVAVCLDVRETTVVPQRVKHHMFAAVIAALECDLTEAMSLSVLPAASKPPGRSLKGSVGIRTGTTGSVTQQKWTNLRVPRPSGEAEVSHGEHKENIQ